MNSKSFSKCLLGLLALGLAALVIAAPPSTAEPFAALVEKEQVALFLTKLGNQEDVDLKVGDFRKVDLNGDGREELVATVDYSGRELYNSVIVTWQEPEGPRVETITVWNMESLEGAIQDLDGDGKLEILTQELLTPYLGVRPYAVWTSVRSWTGKEYVEASSRFTTFYENVILPALKEKLAQFRQAEEKHSAEVTEVALYKVLRIVGQDREAGLQRALSWSSEPDALSRIYAVAVLRDIEGAAAVEALRRLTKDPDREVAIFAKSARTARSRERQ